MKSAAWLVLGVALCLRVLGLHFGLDFADVDRTVLNNNVDERGMVETVQRNFLHGNLDPGSFAFRGPGGFLLFGAVDAACVGGLALTRSVGWAEARAALEANPSLVFLCHRLVNVLAGVLTTWLVFRIARREWGLRCGLAAGLLFACAYVPVREAHYGTVDVLWVLPGLWSLEQMLAWQRAPTGRGHGLRVGLALGLAVAIKYHAIFLALPLFVTLWRVGAPGQGGRAPRALRCAVEVGLVAALTLVALSPGVFVAPESFRSIVGFQLETNTAAAGSYDLLGALRFHLRYSLWYGLGEPVLLLAGFGALRAWWRGDAARWFLLCAALLSPLLYATSAHPVRYAMGLLPLLAFLAAQGFERLTARFSARVTGALLALVLAPSLARALTLGWLLPRPDTRVEMLAELRARALPPAEVLAVGTPHGIPNPSRPGERLFVSYVNVLLGERLTRGNLQVDPAFEERLARLLAAPPRLILWDLSREEVEVPGRDRLAELVRTRYREVLRLDGRRRPFPMPVQGGIHMIPFENPWAMTRPGPPLVLYERLD